MTNCMVCGRPLTDEVSIRRGVGPDCWATLEENKKRDLPYDHRQDLPWDSERRDVVCERRHDPERNYLLHFNLPMRHVSHSPSGWEWGYGGSGPSDFALNILAAFEDCFPTAAPQDRVKAWDGSLVHPDVWRLHQQFKWDAVANLPREGGTIEGAWIRRWIHDHIGADLSASPPPGRS